jgi:pre-mRNA-processing factor SLU7
LSLAANPSQTEAVYREYRKTRKDKERSVKDVLYAKYGGREFAKATRDVAEIAASDVYVEYDQAGRVVHMRQMATPRSKYGEYVRWNSHSAVWGSYWRREDRRRGYA